MAEITASPMFMAYADYDPKKATSGTKHLIRRGYDNGTRENRKNLPSNSVNSTKRYVAGKAPQWAAFDHSDDDDLETRYQAATSNEVRKPSKVRPKYEMPTGKVVPRNQRFIRLPEVVDKDDMERRLEQNKADKTREAKFKQPEIVDYDSKSRRTEDSTRDHQKDDSSDDGSRRRRRRSSSRERPSRRREKPAELDYSHRPSISRRREVKQPEVYAEKSSDDERRQSRRRRSSSPERPSKRRERPAETDYSHRPSISRRREVKEPEVYGEKSRSRRREVKEPEVYEFSRRRRDSSSEDEPVSDRRSRREIKAPTIESVPKETGSVIDRFANYNAATSASKRDVASRRRVESSSSSDEDISRKQKTVNDVIGRSRTRQDETGDYDESGMISRRARLLANRQAKKEYDQYKQEYQERQKQQGKNVEGGYFESDSDSNISEAPKESEEEEESSEEESEVESSESDDVVPKIKPVFTRKKDRYTLEVEDDVNQRTKEIEERKEKTAEERRGWTLKLVEKEKEREHEEMNYKKSKISIKSLAKALAELDSEDGDEEAAFSSWKKREFSRLKREKAEHDAELAKEEDRAKRAEMDESDLIAEAFERKNAQQPKQRQKQNFLQRYYHKGVYFQDDEELVAKAEVRAAAPTMDDKFDRSVLPEVMQTKYFGKRSQTKHTHLKNEDTSRRDAWGMGIHDKPKQHNEPQKKR